MTGKLILEAEGNWKRTALVWLASFAVTVVIVVPLSFCVPLEGLARGAVIAVATYVLMRCAYRLFSTLLPQRETMRRAEWTVTEDTLILDGKTIPRGSIRNVHCWPNRDALGNVLGGWTVNIETTGKNHLLRSLKEGPDMERSVNSLHALVEAMGYGRNWKEQ